MYRSRPWFGLSLAAALAACAVPPAPLPVSAPVASGPGIPAAPLPAGLAPDGQVYPGGVPFRLLATEELPVVGLTTDSEAAGFARARLNDGDLSTQWVNGGYRNATSWAAVELATDAAIGRVDLKTGPSPAGTRYDVQVSSDGTAWKTVLADQVNTSWNLEPKALPAGTHGKFVRIFWRNSPTNPQAHFAIYELVVSGEAASGSSPTPVPTSTPTQTPTPTPTPTPTAPPAEEGSFRPSSGKPGEIKAAGATATSTYSGLSPTRAIDGKSDTQWANGGYREAEAAITIRFDERYTFSSFKVKTGALPAGVSYQIEFSNDGARWANASGPLTNSTWGAEEKSVTGTARFVRIRFSNSPSNPVSRFTLFEIQAFGTLSDLSFPVTTAKAEQDRPALAYLSTADQFLVAWRDQREGSERKAIYAQRMGSDGTRLGAEIALSEPAAQSYNTGGAQVISDGVGYFVIWEDFRSGRREYWAQRVSKDGERLGGNFRLVAPATASGSVFQPVLAYNGNTKEYLVAWREIDTYGYMYVQRLSTAGEPIGEKRLVSYFTNGFGAQLACSAASNEFLLIWADYQDGDVDLYAQRLDAAGANVGERTTLVDAPEDQNQPQLAYNWRDNQYLLTWSDTRDLSQYTPKRLRYLRLDGTGHALGSEVIVPTEAPFPLPPYRVTYDGRQNEYFLAWSGYRSFSAETNRDSDIVGQRVSADGGLKGPNLLIQNSAGTEDEPALAFGYASNQHLIVWTDWRDYAYDGSTDTYGTEQRTDLYARRVKF